MTDEQMADMHATCDKVCREMNLDRRMFSGYGLQARLAMVSAMVYTLKWKYPGIKYTEISMVVYGEDTQDTTCKNAYNRLVYQSSAIKAAKAVLNAGK